jgi:23S rRNA (cytosine1962-C5)-methyltransferase
MAGIVVRPRARILHGHDWVFSSEVLKVFGDPADGDVISIKDGRDRMLGSAIWNSKSQIVARRFSHRRQDLDLDFFKRRIAQAAEYREQRKVTPQLHRVVWSESDGLPSVILDRYGDQRWATLIWFRGILRLRCASLRMTAITASVARTFPEILCSVPMSWSQ